MKTYIKLFLVLLSCGSIIAQNPNLGTSGAQFLQIPVGARAEAMSGAIVGLTDDATSVFWNPAGIVKVNNVQAHFSYMDWFGLFDFNAASIVYNVGDFGTLAASLVSLSTSEIEITTEENPNGTGRYYDYGDVAIGLSYAKYLTDKFNVGVTIKYINQSIYNESASGFAFDIGTQYKLDFQNLTIAMCMTNFGADMKYDGSDLDILILKDDNYSTSRLIPSRLSTEEYPLPLSFQVGVGFDVFEYDFVKMRGGIDVTHPNDNAERAHFGTEFSFYDRFFVRGGYKYNYDDQDFTFGAGANVPLGGSAIYFDYAYSIYDILPSVHRISVNLSF